MQVWIRVVAHTGGFEPSICGLGGHRHIQARPRVHYEKIIKRVKREELTALLGVFLQERSLQERALLQQVHQLAEQLLHTLR